jgi:ribose 5-phosphate isomerase B
MKKEPSTIFLASDHAGFALKEKVKNYLIIKGYSIFDCGPFSFNKEDDYPDFIVPCAKKVAQTKNSLGIVLGKSGQGEAIAANKVKGIKAAVIYSFNPEIIKLSKEHNNSNVLSLGAGFLNEKQAIQSVDLWLNTKFSNESRHKKRLRKIEEYEK